ncbi:dienelactone hydrolase family protein [Nocardioidaceae bacterium]|nr:dienelactone hydrolase family protein [Nocardioidaceae bacterium]
MADVVLFHHVQGLTDGVRALADDIAIAGHTVHTPDLFEGRVHRSIERGLEAARETGSEVLTQRGLDAAADISARSTEPGLVYAGISFGVGIAQRLAQTTPGAQGALLLESCFPASEFGGWPDGLPGQVHGMLGDEFFAEDLPSAQALADGSGHVQLHLYEGGTHLFSDPSLDSYHPQAYAQMLGRVLAFLGGL